MFKWIWNVAVDEDLLGLIWFHIAVVRLVIVGCCFSNKVTGSIRFQLGQTEWAVSFLPGSGSMSPLNGC